MINVGDRVWFLEPRGDWLAAVTSRVRQVDSIGQRFRVNYESRRGRKPPGNVFSFEHEGLTWIRHMKGRPPELKRRLDALRTVAAINLTAPPSP